MMSSVKNNNAVVNAVIGGKTARACDSCIRKQARWYCAADDAFLCQTCDSSVHSANSLARRHERLRLKTASSFKSASNELQANNNSAPTWHRGFTKKARTPRRGRNVNPFHLVPEAGSEEVNSQEENEEQLLYRVPIFDPFVAELCSTPSSTEVEKKETVFGYNYNNLDFLPSDIELAEFAADVESLLGRGLENECVGMEDLGLIDNKDEEEEEDWECSIVKVEDELPCKVEDDGDIEIVGRDTNFELSFDDYDESQQETCVDQLNDKVDLDEAENGKKKISLQLDYEAVIVAWDNQKSPWTTADKPNLDPDECLPEYSMASYGTEIYNPYGGFGCHPVMGDGGREARVSRYREKRRTRLFSKKIRYEVRKLNAEKRPRMKGRFVKRASFAPPPTFPLLK